MKTPPMKIDVAKTKAIVEHRAKYLRGLNTPTTNYAAHVLESCLREILVHQKVDDDTSEGSCYSTSDEDYRSGMKLD